ncbi:LuxR C-terminal-related transcriptional regulator [Streptomyces cathayae]|uniref:LuxR C-terminal-related transcriptional regulator n=1 Tax=Streptomyces cathayae TaxID=3031124 RepID=A0ABY8K6T4_9ACTN|nr:LuxR C-terminal-related transcriptional regulator [Streptomyces sp. HUAS 5]WGD43344.1 LuxR C-terminal-related transcriptional regulator [Streptomyces sp. HUAS 5]
MNRPLRPPRSPRAPDGLLERAGERATLERAVRQVADGGTATVLVRGRPGTGRSALLAEGAALARQAGLHVLTAPGQDGPASVSGPSALFTDDTRSTSKGPASPTGRPEPRPALWVLVEGSEGSEHSAGSGPAPLGAQADPAYELSLRPLTEHAVRTLLARAYGEEAADSLLPAATASTGGNPAVLCAALRRRPGPPPDAAEFAALADRTGRHHLRTVLARASARASALVTASAVAAGHFSFRQVCGLAGISVPDGEQARTEPAVTGLLDSAAAGPRLYDPLVAERALGLLDGDRRRELHERAARLAHREGFPQDVLGRLAARTSLDEPWVPGALHAAGVAARRSGDDDAAVVFFERSLDHGADGGLRTDVLLELAKAQSSRRPVAAERGFRRILRETDVPDRSGALLFAADVLALRAGDDAAAALGAAAARATSEAERRTLRGLHALAAETRPPGPAPDALSPGPWDGRGTPEFDATRAAAGAWRHCLAGQKIDEARRLAGSVLIRAGNGLFTPRLFAARVLAVAEDVALARSGLQRITAEARRHRVSPVTGQALLGLAELALRTGELEQARERLAEAVAEVPRHHWHPRALPGLTAVEALVALESGRTDLAESVLARSARTEVPPDRTGYGLGPARLLFARGVLCLRTGRTSEARAQLRECGRMLRPLGCVNPAVIPWRSHLAMAEAACAAPQAAERLVVESLTAARAWGAPGAVGAVHLWAGPALPDRTALGHLRTAVRLLAGMPTRRLYARAMVALASALLDTGRSAEARSLLDEAVRRGRPFPLTEEVAARLAAQPGSNRARLSPAQLRVALLAAEGRSNTAIAKELSVGVRTVELHLTHTYRALGINGRPDLTVALGHP